MNTFAMLFDRMSYASSSPGAQYKPWCFMNITFRNTLAPASGFGLGAVGESGDCYREEASVSRRKMIFALRIIFPGVGEQRRYLFVEMAPGRG